MIFQGSCVALVTPFNLRNEVNYFELQRLIEFQIASNTKAILILGTTGESSTISPDIISLMSIVNPPDIFKLLNYFR